MSLHPRAVAIAAVAVLAIFAGIRAVVAADEQPAPDTHTTDTLDQVKQSLADDKAILLDVREPEEWKAGHLKAAKSLPVSQMKDIEKLKERTKDWDKSKVIYTHCRAGRRALACAPMLRDLGFDVRALKSGYDDLLGAGFEKASE